MDTEHLVEVGLLLILRMQAVHAKIQASTACWTRAHDPSSKSRGSLSTRVDFRLKRGRFMLAAVHAQPGKRGRFRDLLNSECTAGRTGETYELHKHKSVSKLTERTLDTAPQHSGVQQALCLAWCVSGMRIRVLTPRLSGHLHPHH